MVIGYQLSVFSCQVLVVGCQDDAVDSSSNGNKEHAREKGFIFVASVFSEMSFVVVYTQPGCVRKFR
jgi:hypothetical protein